MILRETFCLKQTPSLYSHSPGLNPSRGDRVEAVNGLTLPTLRYLDLNRSGHPGHVAVFPHQTVVEALLTVLVFRDGGGGEAEEEVGAASQFDYPQSPLPLPSVMTVAPRCYSQLFTEPITAPSPPLIGGRLSEFWERWVEIGAEPWVLSTLRFGYTIPFLSPPPQTLVPLHRSQYLSNPEKCLALAQAVEDMVQKGAIELAPATTPGYYSRIFLVPKPGGRWRPIIDLSGLNTFIDCPSFKMETPASILRSVKKGQWLTSLDLRVRVFSRPHSSQPQALSSVLPPRQGLAVPGLAIRSVHSTSSVYKGTGSSVSLCAHPRSQVTHVHRRLVTQSGHQGGVISSYSLAHRPLYQTRLDSQRREVGCNSGSISRLFGDPIGHRARFSLPVQPPLRQMVFPSEGFPSTSGTTWRCYGYAFWDI